MTDVVAKRFEQHIAAGMAIIQLSADALESATTPQDLSTLTR